MTRCQVSRATVWGRFTAGSDTGIIDQDVEATQFADRPINGVEDVVLLKDVAAHPDAAATQGFDFFDDDGRLLFIARRHDDIRPVLCQPHGNGAPNPPVTAGNDGHLSGKIKHVTHVTTSMS